jgi:hypothetical protein
MELFAPFLQQSQLFLPNPFNLEGTIKEAKTYLTEALEAGAKIHWVMVKDLSCIFTIPGKSNRKFYIFFRNRVGDN